MMKFSVLNIMTKTNIMFISNSNANMEGVAINVERSIMNTEGDLFFINNSGKRETVCIQTSILSLGITQYFNSSTIQLKNRQGGCLHTIPQSMLRIMLV